MPRRGAPHWSARDNCYKTATGGSVHYFRGIAKGDMEAAWRAFNDYLRELDARARPPEPTADDLCVAFVEASAARGIKPKTRTSHAERLTKWSEWDPGDGLGPIKDRPASGLKAGLLRTALRTWEREGLSDHYRAGICRSVKAAWAWAASDEGGHLIATNPFAEVRGPSVERSPVRYADRREVAAFLRFAWRRPGYAPGVIAQHQSWRAGRGLPPIDLPASYGDLYRRFGRLLALLVRMAVHLGCRPGELCSAWWDDFDPKAGTLTFPPDRHKTGSKTGRDLVLFLEPSLVRALLRERARPDRHPVAIFVHKRGRGAEGRGAEVAEHGEPWGVFTTLPGGRPSFEGDSKPLTKTIRKLRAEAIAEGARRLKSGIPTRGLDLIRDEGDNRFVLYRLRHTAASDHLMNGGNPATVAELMGTSVRMMETTYGHLLNDHLSRSAADLAAARRKKPNPEV